MIVLFDTSVIVSALVTSHPRHLAAFSWLKKAQANEFKWYIAAHSLLETYAVLTKLPVTPRISPAVAKLLLTENIEKYAKVVSLTPTDYVKITQSTAQLGLSGGIVYDTIIVKTAEKIKATKLITSNLRDFSRLVTTQEIEIIGI